MNARITPLLTALSILVWGATGLVAQQEPAGQPAQHSSEAPDATRADSHTLGAVLSALAAQTGATAVVESPMSGWDASQFSAPNIDRAVEMLTTAFPELRWRKVYLRPGERPTPEKLAGWLRALDQVESAGLVLTDDKGAKMTYLARDVPVEPDYFDTMADRKVAFDPSPVYILYAREAPRSVRAEASAPQTSGEEPMPKETPRDHPGPQASKAILQDWLRNYSTMGETDRQQALRGALETVAGLGGDTLRQMGRDWRDMMRNMTPEERRQYGVIRIGPPRGGRRGPQAGGPGGPPPAR